ncbi:unnamed protein product [Polarella glacialis]|uniref:Rab-GAP TBC domain-containing protein n=1 Tax=Polarella glacialis TaxID=89957 RepID=A0A813L0U7_POLGL|nr:unnamed protein product [Polarella glacialis]
MAPHSTKGRRRPQHAQGRTSQTPEQEQVRAVQAALAARDFAALQELAFSRFGFCSCELRRAVWQFLLGVNPEKGIDSSWRKLLADVDQDVLDGKEARVMQADVQRSVYTWDVHSGIRKSARSQKREQLLDVMLAILRQHPGKLSYFQGFHDIALVFLEVGTPSQAFHMVERLALFHLSDQLCCPFDKGLIPLLGLLFCLLERVDAAVATALREADCAELHFAVPWALAPALAAVEHAAMLLPGEGAEMKLESGATYKDRHADKEAEASPHAFRMHHYYEQSRAFIGSDTRKLEREHHGYHPPSPAHVKLRHDPWPTPALPPLPLPPPAPPRAPTLRLEQMQYRAQTLWLEQMQRDCGPCGCVWSSADGHTSCQTGHRLFVWNRCNETAVLVFVSVLLWLATPRASQGTDSSFGADAMRLRSLCLFLAFYGLPRLVPDRARLFVWSRCNETAVLVFVSGLLGLATPRARLGTDSSFGADAMDKPPIVMPRVSAEHVTTPIPGSRQDEARPLAHTCLPLPLSPPAPPRPFPPLVPASPASSSRRAFPSPNHQAKPKMIPPPPRLPPHESSFGADAMRLRSLWLFLAFGGLPRLVPDRAQTLRLEQMQTTVVLVFVSDLLWMATPRARQGADSSFGADAIQGTDFSFGADAMRLRSLCLFRPSLACRAPKGLWSLGLFLAFWGLPRLVPDWAQTLRWEQMQCYHSMSQAHVKLRIDSWLTPALLPLAPPPAGPAMSVDLLGEIVSRWKGEIHSDPDSILDESVANQLPHPDDPALGVVISNLVHEGMSINLDDRDFNQFSLNPSCNSSFSNIHNRTWVVHHVSAETLRCMWAVDSAAEDEAGGVPGVKPLSHVFPDLCQCSTEVAEEPDAMEGDTPFWYPRQRFSG